MRWRRHHHHHRWVSILFGTIDAQGAVIMAETNLDVDLSTSTGPVYASLGELTDVNGNVVTDTVVSATYSLGDDTLATIETQDGVGNATFTLLAVDGVETVSVTGTTAAGSTVTGEATITITGSVTPPVGPATTVAINLSLTAPPSATGPAAPVVEPPPSV